MTQPRLKNSTAPRTLRKTLLLSLMATLIGLAVVEGGFRIARKMQGNSWITGPFDKLFYHPFPADWTEVVPKKKPDGVFRIVALGGSTTRGWPYGPKAAFPAWIDSALNPPEGLRPEGQRRVEVFNLGMDSLDSADVLEIIQRLGDRSIDMYLIYSGHNEYSGHYFLTAPSVWLDRLQSFRQFLTRYSAFGQWLHHQAVNAMRNQSGSGSLGLLVALNKVFLFTHDPQKALNRFPFPSSVRQHLADRFIANVDEIIDTVGPNRLLFVPPVSNALGLRPLRSHHDPDGIPRSLREADYHLKLGFETLPTQPVTAYGFFSDAVVDDPWYAESWFALGLNCLILGNGPCADESSDAAVENEAVIHRLPPTFRARLIQRLHQRKVPWVDLQTRLAVYPSSRVLPPSGFLDFVHPRWSMHRKIAESLLPEIAQRVGSTDSPAEMKRRMDIYEERLKSEMDFEAIERPIAGGIGWFYLLFGEAETALPFLEEGVKKNPEAAHYRLFLAMAYQRLGRTDEARSEAKKAFELQPVMLEKLFESYAAFEKEWLTTPK